MKALHNVFYKDAWKLSECKEEKEDSPLEN